MERSWILSSTTSVSSHRTSNYRRGLIFARRYAGLQQYRLWARERFAPNLSARIDSRDFTSPTLGDRSTEADVSDSVSSALNTLADMQQTSHAIVSVTRETANAGAIGPTLMKSSENDPASGTASGSTGAGCIGIVPGSTGSRTRGFSTPKVVLQVDGACERVEW